MRVELGKKDGGGCYYSSKVIWHMWLISTTITTNTKTKTKARERTRTKKGKKNSCRNKDFNHAVIYSLKGSY